MDQVTPTTAATISRISTTLELGRIMRWSAVSSLIVLGCWATASTPVSEPHLLDRALRDFRPHLARLTTVREFAPCRELRETNQSVRGLGCQATSVAPQVRARLANRRSAGLRLGELESVRNEIEKLEGRILEGTESADIHADLAAAFLMRASLEDEPEDLLDAIEHCDLALDLEPGHVEATYNLALATETLGLTRVARRVWNDYLVVDPSSGWADEARESLAAIERRLDLPTAEEIKDALVAALADPQAELSPFDAQDLREHAETSLIDCFARLGEGTCSGDLDLLLDQAQRVGGEIERRIGDLVISETVERFRRASDQERVMLHRAHRSLAEGFQLYEKWRHNDAGPKLTEARTLFEGLGNPQELRAALWQASNLDGLERLDDALALATRAREACSATSAQGLCSLICWIEGLEYNKLGRPVNALASFQAGVAAAERAGERENRGALGAQKAEALFFLGQDRDAWRTWTELFSTTLAGTLRADRFSALFGAIDALKRQGRPRPALFLFEELVAAGPQKTEVKIDLARLEAQLRAQRKDYVGAGEALKRATILRSGTTLDPTYSERLGIDLELSEGHLLSQQGKPKAVGLLRSSAEGYARALHLWFELDARIELAGTHRRLGARSEALAELARAQALIERTARDLPTSQRGRFLVTPLRRTFDEAILLAETATERADLIERVKRNFLGSNAKSFPETSIVTGPRVVIASYAVIEDRLITMIYRDHHFEEQIAVVERPRLRELIKRQETASAGRELAALLIEPLRPFLDGAQLLVLVPDRELFGVAFAALRMTDSRYLIEEIPILVAPSLTAYAEAQHRAERLGPIVSSDRLLAVGDPHPTPFGPLVHAQEEVRQIGVSYTNHEILLGDEATRDVLVNELPSARIFHFAGHALAHERDALNSVLVLSGGEIPAHQILELDLKHLKLAVLSACETGNAVQAGAERPAGLAAAFLAAGVPTVIATLRPVDDRVARELLSALHRFLLSGLSPADALRRAQLELLSDSRQSNQSDWAHFQVFGAGRI